MQKISALLSLTLLYCNREVHRDCLTLTDAVGLCGRSQSSNQT